MGSVSSKDQNIVTAVTDLIIEKGKHLLKGCSIGFIVGTLAGALSSLVQACGLVIISETTAWGILASVGITNIGLATAPFVVIFGGFILAGVSVGGAIKLFLSIDSIYKVVAEKAKESYAVAKTKKEMELHNKAVELSIDICRQCLFTRDLIEEAPSESE
eukprot:TRINITY_DN11365_c0_g1_i1.p1 TRINITY_DN11365_c0_g1~~TRINITY_DN11365_c0_g1_i1.p1  ORF type:complete len:160 (-),score=26.64 TRINITY_DN11365_c0_g1_i1:55-534(-)